MNDVASPTLQAAIKDAYDRGLRKGWLRTQAGYDAATFSRIIAGARPPRDSVRLHRLLAALGVSLEVSAKILSELSE